MAKRYAVIMAGGAGTRLWPLSRRDRPKQLMRLFDGASLLRLSYERVARLLPASQIHVIAARSHRDVVRAELPELPDENLFGEPVGRDTANAVGMAAAILRHRDPHAIMGVFTADHMITPLDRFDAAVEQAYVAAENHPKALVTIGVRPASPVTSYGYLARGEKLGESLYQVRRFTEKPNQAEAMKYLASGEYYWNSGMFVWRADTILGELKRHMPQSHGALCDIAACWDSPSRDARLDQLYPTLMRISIDFAVMERAERVLVVEMNCNWVDVGSWPAMESVAQADDDGNVNVCERSFHLASRGNIVVSEDNHLIATIGVDDLVIIHSPDATLVCTRRDAQSIKELVDSLRGRFGEDYV